MSIGFDPNLVYYAVVEYLPLSGYIYDPVDGKPEQEGQYRLVCLAADSDEAARVARLLAAVGDGCGCTTSPTRRRFRKMRCGWWRRKSLRPYG